MTKKKYTVTFIKYHSYDVEVECNEEGDDIEDNATRAIRLAEEQFEKEVYSQDLYSSCADTSYDRVQLVEH